MIITPHIKKAIDSELSRPLSLAELNLVRNDGFLDKLIKGVIGPSGVAAHVQQWREATGESMEVKSRDRGAEAAPVRSRAISALVANLASEDSGVIAFRSDVLQNHLILRKHVADWVRNQGRADGPQTIFLMVPIPPDGTLKLRREKGKNLAIVPTKPLCISNRNPATGTWTEELEFRGVGEKTHLRPVTMNGVLDRLRVLSEKLAADYGWRRSDATTFILTGKVPRIPAFIARYERRDLVVLNRLTLSVDLALSPKELARYYRNMRRRYYLGRGHHSINERHSALATFINSRPDQETRQSSMQAWNAKYQKWKYEHVPNFVRDVLKARRRILKTTD
jgi:hypothetical protein